MIRLFELDDKFWFVIEFKSEIKSYSIAINENDIPRFFGIYKFAKIFKENKLNDFFNLLDEEGIKKIGTINESDIIIVCKDYKEA